VPKCSEGLNGNVGPRTLGLEGLGGMVLTGRGLGAGAERKAGGGGKTDVEKS